MGVCPVRVSHEVKCRGHTLLSGAEVVHHMANSQILRDPKVAPRSNFFQCQTIIFHLLRGAGIFCKLADSALSGIKPNLFETEKSSELIARAPLQLRGTKMSIRWKIKNNNKEL